MCSSDLSIKKNLLSNCLQLKKLILNRKEIVVTRYEKSYRCSLIRSQLTRSAGLYTETSSISTDVCTAKAQRLNWWGQNCTSSLESRFIQRRKLVLSLQWKIICLALLIIYHHEQMQTQSSIEYSGQCNRHTAASGNLFCTSTRLRTEHKNTDEHEINFKYCYTPRLLAKSTHTISANMIKQLVRVQDEQRRNSANPLTAHQNIT